MPNRLKNELSPYLLQHAENPVEWYPWCSEALQRSQDEDKPIFLSIGYSACHWCHVMEHESFESPRIAEILNSNFINIKVDREERPDLDQLYMNAVMALRGGGGGWPLSVFLTPHCEVFFGGTYWPPESRMGMPGFDHVLTRVLHAYREKREQVNDQSAQVTQWIENSVQQTNAGVEVGPALLGEAAQSLEQGFDFENGGFGTAPKFPHPMDLSLLLRLWKRGTSEMEAGSSRLLEMVELNLKKMAYGGIFDHLAGGFARYSVDERWLVPHFEKMLYDNGLLATIYFETHRATGNPFYAMIGRKTLDYLINQMTSPQGGFYSTEDADSEGVEGKFYVWSRDEVKQVLGEDVAGRFCKVYDVTEHGNFEGANILNMTQTFGERADEFGMSKDDLRAEMRQARAQLLAVRDQRIRPGLDDKILCCWNALAIGAMCEGTLATGEPKYLKAAEAAFAFVWSTLRDSEGRLLRVWRLGTAKQTAFLDDYAYLLDALFALYQTSQNEYYVDCAHQLIDQMCELFGDEKPGFFFTPSHGESLIARTKDLQDSSVPSGNSVAATALLKWGRLCGMPAWIQLATETIGFGAPLMAKSPMASGQMLVALQDQLAVSREFVVLLPAGTDRAMYLNKLNEQWRPGTTIVCRVESEDENRSNLIDRVLQGKGVVDQQPTLYLCSQFTCQAPVVGAEAIMTAMDTLEP